MSFPATKQPMIVPLDELIIPTLRIAERLLDTGILEIDVYSVLDLIDNAYDALRISDGSAPTLAAFAVDLLNQELQRVGIDLDELDRRTFDAMIEGYEASLNPS